MRVTIASWNINSVRLRMDLVARFVREHAPDFLCLQETKCANEHFPREALAELGYRHQAINGQKGYHGVAIVSRHAFLDTFCDRYCDRTDGRHVAVRLAGADGEPVTLHNFYVPAGGDEPDREANPKFAHKLDFVAEMTRRFSQVHANGGTPPRPERTVLVGDLNIAPLEHDVWSHKQLLKVVSHTPVEVDGLTRLREAGGWVDAARAFVHPGQKLYTWWSYRSPSWDTSDKGRRLDHVWLSPDLEPALANVSILREARGWPRPSDHVPVMAALDLDRAGADCAPDGTPLDAAGSGGGGSLPPR